MILSFPVRKTEIRLVDGSRAEAYELLPGFVRVTSETQADHDAQAPVGGHILISNPISEWALDQLNRLNLSAGEKLYIRLHTEPACQEGDGIGQIDVNNMIQAV